MKKLSEILCSVCECAEAEIPPDQPLRSTEGWDSMRAINFQMEVESAFDVDLSDVQITGSSTLGEVAALLQQKGVSVA
jgi:acyl carrier protein